MAVGWKMRDHRNSHAQIPKQAATLPRNCLKSSVEIVGVEPTTLCLQGRCSSQLSYTPIALLHSKRMQR